MAAIESQIFDLGGLDALARGRSAVHRLDPRAKLLVALAFIITVVSFGKYELAGLAPLFVYPVAIAALGGLPARPIVIRLLLAAPFVVLVGAFNPLIDRAIVARLGAVEVSGGWVSFLSIIARSLLTLSAGLILIATTGMTAVCAALGSFGVPRVFVIQLLLLYRYLFVLADEAARMVRAFTLRAGGGRVPLRIFGSLAGQLLLRALERAQRLHVAMLCRGFDGEFRLMRPLRPGWADLIFVAGWITFFALVRFYNLPALLGHAVMGSAR